MSRERVLATLRGQLTGRVPVMEPASVALDEVRRDAVLTVGAMGNIEIDLLFRGSVAEVRRAPRDLLS